jgi:uncharacterized protein (DUF2132 family)
MKIEIKYPIPNQRPYYAELYVNGYKLGEYLGGAKKPYLNKEKWAREQIKKRNIVIERNIKRLKEELKNWEKEKEALKPTK